jgi:intracellular septation protein
MQLLIDFFPVIAFFAAYKLYGIYVATGVIIAAMAVQIAAQWFRHGTVSKMLLISGLLVAVFGGMTLVLRNPIFLQWKPTIVNALFAVVFLGSQFIGGKTLTERMMGHAVQLESSFWRQLNMMWVANFTLLGIANLYVVYNFDEATWVNFKLFGVLGITLAVVLIQGIWIAAKTAGREQNENAD